VSCFYLSGTSRGIKNGNLSPAEGPRPANRAPCGAKSKTEDASAATGINLGLGLYITKEIVVAHGGEINVTSSEQGGTTFTAKLPR